MRKNRLLAGLIVAVAMSGVAVPASAGIPELPPVGGLLRGEVLSAESFRADDGHIYTEAVVGTLLGSSTVVGRGGRVGDAWEAVEHEPTLVPGALVSLDLGVVDGVLRVLGGESSAGEGNAAAPTDDPVAAGPGFKTLFGNGWCFRGLPADYVVETPVSAPWLGAVRRGFRSWNAQTSSWMAFRYAGGAPGEKTGNDGVNRVFFQPAGEGFLARAFVYGTGSQIVGFDVHVNTSYRMTADTSGFHLETIVRHEAGHTLGLAHSDSRSSVMYPTIGWTERKPLGAGDLAGNRALHPYHDYDVRVIARDPDGTVRMLPGARSTVAVKLQNTGRTPWNGPFRGIELRTDGPRKRDSAFFDDPTWVSRSEPGDPITGVVCHGEVVTVRWAMKAPTQVRQYREAFGVRIGDAWMTDESPVWNVAVPV